MRVVDLSGEHEKQYFGCLEEWSDEAKVGARRRELWYRSMTEKGLRVKLALDDNGVIGGMVQYLPIEYSNAIGRDLYFVNCIWVHGHQQGRGNFQRRGMGKALIKAAEDDARELGKKGIVAWGLSMPFWMKAKWFKRQGFTEIDRRDGLVLMWKPFSDDVERPRWNRETKTPVGIPGKVTVTAIVSGWCTAYNGAVERARRAASEFGENVVFREISTIDEGALAEWGFTDGLYIDEKQVRTGPPPSYEKIRRQIAKKVKKLPRRGAREAE